MDVMTRSELADVLHELAGLVERPTAESGRTAEKFRKWLEARGFVRGDLLGQWVLREGDDIYVVLREEDDVDVEIKESPMDHGVLTAQSRVPDDRVAIRVFVSTGHMDRQVIRLTDVSPSLADLVGAMNGGALKREIDEAVDWDPELAV
jgi:hypothetical protein